MTSILLGPMVADARGSTGGTVFSRNRHGAYTKQRVTPTNPNTAKQVTARALLATILNEWMTVLTVAQRDLWNAAVQLFTTPNRLGQATNLTGLQWYMRCNLMLDLTGQALVTTPPVVPIVPAPTVTLTHVGATGIQISDLDNWDDTAFDKLLVKNSPNLAQTKNYYKGPWDRVFIVDTGVLAALPFTIIGSGSLVVDSRVFMSFRTVNADGANSAEAIFSVDVGDPA